MSRISFSVTKQDAEIIGQIAKRLGQLIPKAIQMDTVMDLTATHVNGCPLNLAALLVADDETFLHDCGGIRINLNRTTGQLDLGFQPRMAAETEEEIAGDGCEE